MFPSLRSRIRAAG